MEVNIKDLYKNKLDNLWKEQPTEITDRGYAMEQYLYTDSLLFLGLNPSTRGEKGFYTAECDQFFAKSMEIADEHSAHFCHHDLFPIRETKQNVLLSLEKKYPEFFREQLGLTKEIIERVKPRMIVILNAEACRIFQSLYGFEPGKHWNETLGVDILPQLGSIPVLFSGMLSGQRALDLGSFARLKWHIRNTCRNLQISFEK
ncbi:MAG: hypothetical protein J6M23_08750 [Bacteroidales bacterium]|nr:hypothetical protein [Bacteroidales bacterium]